MTDENSNPETGELSDDAAMAFLAAQRQQQPEADPEEQAEPDSEAETEETEDSPEEPQRYRVKVDGEEAEVSLDELLNGYQRDADYRRKTQTLADERRQIEAEKTRQKEITERLISEHQKLVGNETKEPDWVQLAKEDPIGYIQQRAEWDANKALRDRARQTAEQLVNEQRIEIAKAEAEKLRLAVPEWSDPSAFKTAYDGILKGAAESYGFDAQEVASVLDHRTLLVLKDAIAYRALKAAKPAVDKKVASAPKSVVKPGSPAEKSELKSQEIKSLAAKALRSGSDADFVALLQAKRKK